MAEVTIKATVTPDHRLTGVVPKELPAGEVEATLRPVLSEDERRQRKEALRLLLKALRDSGRRADSGAMDARIRELRDSWD